VPLVREEADVSQLVSGEAVALDLRPARLPSRMLAAAIDIAIELVVFFLVLLVLGTVALGDDDVATAVALLMVVALVVGYPVAFESLWRGRTPGKAALGIRVVRDDGGPIRFRHALTRALFNIIERPGVTFGVAAVFTSLLSSRGKRIGDIVAGTFVLQERIPTQYVAPIHMPPHLAQWALSLDLSRLPDDLALAARGFLGRSGQLRADARERMGAQMSAAVASYVTPPPPRGTSGWAYLAAVVAERRRRDGARLPVRTGYGAPGPSPWQPGAPSPGWGAIPDRPRWAESAPSTGSPPPLGSPPATGGPPYDPGPPRVPPPPSPQWGPAPVAASPPPGSAARGAPALTGAPDSEPAPPVRNDGGFALPG
jgi:uncharacterized RDD family membrane protein YckC